MTRRIARIAAIALLGVVLLASGCTQVTRVPGPEGLPAETAEVSLFYSTGRSLFEERRLVDKKNVYASTLKELLLASPESNTDVAIVQPVAEFRSATVEDGMLTVDWEADVLEFEADPDEEMLALAGILRTFGEFDEVRKVRFTVEGKSEGKAGGRDIEGFWGDVSLKGQPWDVLRSEKSSETTAAE